MSDIRVFVTFSRPNGAVFAGETLECNIVFKNVSNSTPATAGIPRLASRVPPSPLSNGYSNRNRLAAPSLPPPGAAQRGMGSRPSSRPPSSLGHKPTLSTSVVGGRSPMPSSVPLQPLTASGPAMTPKGPPPDGGTKHKHKRSISIISIGADGPAEETKSRPSTAPRRPGHGRSASLQFSPRNRTPVPGSSTPGLAPVGWQSKASQPSTPIIRESEPAGTFQFPLRRTNTAGSSGPVTPGTPAGLKTFRFPPTLSMDQPAIGEHESAESPESVGELPRIMNIDVPSHNDDDTLSELAGPSAANISAIRNLNGIIDTPRTSMDFYSQANSTTDTLISEFDTGRLGIPKPMRGGHSRRHSLLSITTQKAPETLMMGYAQVSGSFILDGSLMQSSVFDEVKRKGVLGGQRGGGVVGIETKKQEGGSWWGLGGGLGLGIFGGSNMSTIAEMKSIASSKSIPILSTPQSVLFVDLRLAPGESRTYKYKFPLPETLPPSHRGKAIKIVYNLVIGTQRPGKGVQHPKTIEVPFRVYPYVRSNGMLHVHDLFTPIIRLYDCSTTTCVDEQPSLAVTSSPNNSRSHGPTMNDFLSYVDSLLKPRTPSLANALSPSPMPFFPFAAPLPTPIRATQDEEITPKEAIEQLILGVLRPPGTPSSSFAIARSGLRVATLTLARPAYKLGEAITAVLDFTGAQLTTYHVHVTLESSESIAPDLALRSEASVHRTTRKIHAMYSCMTLYADRTVTSLSIPSSASATFETSGVSLKWAIRIEFITLSPGHSQQHLPSTPPSPTSPTHSSALPTPPKPELLDLTFSDQRGEIREARQGITVESFEAEVPVRVLPNPGEMGIVGIGGSSSTVAGAGEGGYAV